MKSLYETNAEKLMQLQPSKQWAALCWLNDCARLNLQFRITEVYRTQERQNQLYAQGRAKPGPIVTYTKSSNHTKRLACDVYPINCGYADIEAVAEKYGITHPFVRAPFVDLPHFEFAKAKEKPTPNIPKSENAARRRLEREIKGSVQPRTERLKERLAKRTRSES